MTRTILLTVFTLVAFAANSILCRLALAVASIDPVSFTALRVVGGAAILLPFLDLTRRSKEPAAGSGTELGHGSSISVPIPAPSASPVLGVTRRSAWRPAAAAALFAYAIAFSLGYVSLATGTGALLLFGMVQVTMIAAGLWQGERPAPASLVGMLAALAGLAYLLAPGVTAPDPWGAALMAIAGVSWGIYSLLGRGVPVPSTATARNFLLASPLALIALLPGWMRLSITPRGAWLALLSGAVTSGLGYVLWYAALRGHTATSAAIVQLAVPVLAAIGGVFWLGEALTARLAISSVLTLGGVALAVATRRTRFR